MAQRYDITIDQGSPFQMEVDLFDENMNPDETVYTGAGKMKKHYTSSNAYTFDVEVTDSKVLVTLSSTYTANIVPGRYVYDVEIYNNADEANTFALRVIEGVATVTPSVTD